MSVVVNMQISISDGMAHREMVISRVSNLDKFGPNVSENMISTYSVKSRWCEATFEHRYGDDVLELIQKAITALRRAGMTRF